MATVLNRTTKELLYSVHTPNYSVDDWIINPDLSAVEGVSRKYWLISGDSVSEMNSSQKNVVDTALLPGIKEEKKTSLREEADQLIVDQGYSVSVQLSLVSQYSASKGDRTSRASHTRTFLDWVETVDREVVTKQNLVDDQTSIGGIHSITINTSSLISRDPGVTIKSTLLLDSTSGGLSR